MNDKFDDLINSAKQVALTDAERASIRDNIASVVANSPIANSVTPSPVRSSFFNFPFLPYFAPLAILVFVGVYYVSIPDGNTGGAIPASNDIAPEQISPSVAPVGETRSLKTMEGQAIPGDTVTTTNMQTATSSPVTASSTTPQLDTAGMLIESQTKLPSGLHR